MSTELESIIRPFQSGQTTPARTYYTPGQIGVPNVVLKIGQTAIASGTISGGMSSGGTVSSSISYSQTYYCVYYMVELKKDLADLGLQIPPELGGPGHELL